jgi:hypothetical protein
MLGNADVKGKFVGEVAVGCTVKKKVTSGAMCMYGGVTTAKVLEPIF